MYIAPDCAELRYCGRIDDTDKKAPVMVYPCSYVKMRFRGRHLRVVLENHSVYMDNYMGYFLDEVQGRILLGKSGRQSYNIEIPAGQDMPDTETGIHEFMLFKRMDACHHVTFYGFELEDGSEVFLPPQPPRRRIEVYGDSVSAGEVSEATAYTGKEDPVHNGEYSNSWYSYAWMTARKLNAQIHDIAQGGIALLDHTGWFCEPDAVGMESMYDKIEYHPLIGISREWDFAQYIPHVVIVAVGQNDSHPKDYMKEDFTCKKADVWRVHYQLFLEKLRARYPDAHIICCTTLLNHDRAWDDSIGQVCKKMQDPKITHYMFRRNGNGTPGHLRITEAEEMAEELAAYISGLEITGWE